MTKKVINIGNKTLVNIKHNIESFPKFLLDSNNVEILHTNYSTIISLNKSNKNATNIKAVKTYYIGYQGPLTGGEPSLGINEQNAVKYAIKLFEEKNKNIKIKLILIDDKGDSTVAGIVASEIVKNNSILGIIGPAYSGTTIASLPYYKSSELVLISPSATRVSLTDPTSTDFGGPIFHRVIVKDEIEGLPLAKYATVGISAAMVFVFDDQSFYAVQLRGFVETGLKEVAGSKLVGGDSVPNTITDFTTTIAKIKASGANVVIYTGYFAQAALFIKQLRDSGSKAVFAGGDGVCNQEFPKLAGASAEGSKIIGISSCSLANIDKKIEADFMKKIGVSPGSFSIQSFDAANILLSGIEAGKTTRANMLAYVKSYKGKSIGGNTLKFDAYGDVTNPVAYSFEIKGGVINFTGPVNN